MLDSSQHSKLVEVIRQRFNQDELKDLCRSLDLSYEEIKGEELQTKVHELIDYLDRRDRIIELIEAIIEVREFLQDELQEIIPPRRKQASHFVPEFHIVVGRQKEKEEILQFLEGKQPDKNQCVLVVYGMPGIGKTALVAETIGDRDKASAFSEIIWLPLESVSDEFISYLANEMGIHYTDRTQRLKAIIKILQREKVLLVLDGADNFLREKPGQANELEDFLEKLRPDYNGKVLITTQQQPLRLKNVHLLEVQPLSPESSEEWFLYCWESIGKRKISDQVRQEARKICRSDYLGGHPLAIETMARMSAHSFEPLKEHRKRLWQAITLMSHDDTILDNRTYTKKGVIAVIRMAFAQLSADAKRLLGRISFLPSTFSATALKEVAQVHPTLSINSLLDELANSSLITQDFERGSCRTHSLVRALARRDFTGHSEYPESKEAQKLAGRHMIETDEFAHWLPGMKNLLEAEAFAEFLQLFEKKYGSLGNAQLFDIEHLPNELMKPIAYYCMAWTYNEKGWIEDAISFSTSVKEMLLKQPASHLKDALLLRTTAIIANNLRQKKAPGYETQIKLMLKDAITSLKQMREPDTLLSWEVGQLYLLTGIIYAEEPITAKKALEKAKQIYEELRDINQYLKALSSLATILLNHARNDQDTLDSLALSRKIIEKTRQLPDSLNRERQEITEVINLADSLITLEQFTEANQWIEEGMQFSNERMLDWAKLPLQINLAKIEIRTNKLTEAEKHLVECRELASELSNAFYDEEINGYLKELEQAKRA